MEIEPLRFRTATRSEVLGQPPRVLPFIDFRMEGFENRAEAEHLSKRIADAISILSCEMDLRKVAEVTVAHDFWAALAEVQGGSAQRNPVSSATARLFETVAVSVPSLREGAPRAHLVLLASSVAALVLDNSDSLGTSTSIMAHVCGHAAEQIEPGRGSHSILSQPRLETPSNRFLERPAERLWEEYAACHYAAVFSERWMTETPFRDGMVDAVQGAPVAAQTAVASYRVHGDATRLAAELSGPLTDPLWFAAHLAGHIDGSGGDAVKEMGDYLARAPMWTPRILEMVRACRGLWDSRYHWADASVFGELMSIVASTFADHGLRLSPNGGVGTDASLAP